MEYATLMKIPKMLLPGMDGELIRRLENHIPKLSRIEINIAGLVHLGYMSKDIADLFGCSVRTIENHRYRIGKKLFLGSLEA